MVPMVGATLIPNCDICGQFAEICLGIQVGGKQKDVLFAATA